MSIARRVMRITVAILARLTYNTNKMLAEIKNPVGIESPLLFS